MSASGLSTEDDTFSNASMDDVRKKRHNESEIKRRNRVNGFFEDLRSLLAPKCDNFSSRSVILSATLETVKEAPLKLKHLQDHVSLITSGKDKKVRFGGWSEAKCPLCDNSLCEFSAEIKSVLADQADQNTSSKKVSGSKRKAASTASTKETPATNPKKQKSDFGVDLAALFSHNIPPKQEVHGRSSKASPSTVDAKDFREMFESTAIPMAFMEPGGKLIHWNTSFENALWMGQKPTTEDINLFSYLQPIDLLKAKTAISKVVQHASTDSVFQQTQSLEAVTFHVFSHQRVFQASMSVSVAKETDPSPYVLCILH